MTTEEDEEESNRSLPPMLVKIHSSFSSSSDESFSAGPAQQQQGGGGGAGEVRPLLESPPRMIRAPVPSGPCRESRDDSSSPAPKNAGVGAAVATPGSDGDGMQQRQRDGGHGIGHREGGSDGPPATSLDKLLDSFALHGGCCRCGEATETTVNGDNDIACR